MIKFKLAELLEEKELNQRYVKLKTGIRSGTVNAYYHGFAKRLNVEDLDKICKALDCRIEDIIEYVPDKD